MFLVCALTAQAGTNEALDFWAKRDSSKELTLALDEFEKILKEEPTNLEFLTLFVRGSFMLANYHTSGSKKKLKILEKARGVGEKFLFEGRSYEPYLPKLKVKEAPLLYWVASVLGYWSHVNGIFSSVRNKGQIVAMIKRVEELDPKFFYGSVPRYWGAYYAVVPGIAGGDMKLSKQKFDQAIQEAPEYLGAKTLMAELYYTKMDDRAGFKKILNEVLESNISNPEIAPENKIEMNRAKLLLSKEEELF